MRHLPAKTIMTLAFAAFVWMPRCSGQVTLAWTQPASGSVSGYYLCWGTQSGVYSYTNIIIPATTATFVVSNLVPDQVYYFAMQSFVTNGAVSPFSNEAVFTNTQAEISTYGAGNTGPPAPPGIGPPGSGTNSTAGSGTGGSGSSSNITQALFWGVPPLLTLSVSNQQPIINIGATVGATLMLQSANDPSSADWATVTNLNITNIAETAETNSAPADALDVAFVPGAQTIMAPTNTGAACQIFRVVMPYDYMILADMVLQTKSYTPRLVMVNMPGVVCDDVCYVTESSSFIHFSHTNSALQLESSGSTIREIANTLAGSLNLDWTSASEFAYSNGLGYILATVIETDPPSSDPVAGQNPPSGSIVINF